MKHCIKKIVLSLVIVSSIFMLCGYTFKLCYNGSDDPEVIAPDSISVSSVIHGGSTCWAKFNPLDFKDNPLIVINQFGDNFTATVNKGSYIDVSTSNVGLHPTWNCYLVPETVNGLTVRHLSDDRPERKRHGPSDADLGETWQIKKTKTVTETHQLPGLPGRDSTLSSHSIDWFVDIENGLKKCKPFETVTKKQPAVTKKYQTMAADEQATLRKDFFDAAFNHRLDEIKEIVAMGIDVNVKDDDGETALLLALSPNFTLNPCFSDKIIPIVELLLSKGADTTITAVLEPFKIKKWALGLVANWGTCFDTSGELVNCDCPAGTITNIIKLLLGSGAAGRNNELAREALPTAQRAADKGSKEALEVLNAYLETHK